MSAGRHLELDLFAADGRNAETCPKSRFRDADSDSMDQVGVMTLEPRIARDPYLHEEIPWSTAAAAPLSAPSQPETGARGDSGRNRDLDLVVLFDCAISVASITRIRDDVAVARAGRAS